MSKQTHVIIIMSCIHPIKQISKHINAMTHPEMLRAPRP